MKKTAKKSKKSIGKVADYTITTVLLVVLATLLVSSGFLIHNLYKKCMDSKNTAASAVTDVPALIDKAMGMEGAKLFTPHRELADMGLGKITGGNEECPPSIKFCSPVIGVATKNGWCLLDLGYRCGLETHIQQCAEGTTFDGFGLKLFMSGGTDTFAKTYDAFVDCVKKNGDTQGNLNIGSGYQKRSDDNQSFEIGNYKFVGIANNRMTIAVSDGTQPPPFTYECGASHKQTCTWPHP